VVPTVLRVRTAHLARMAHKVQPVKTAKTARMVHPVRREIKAPAEKWVLEAQTVPQVLEVALVLLEWPVLLGSPDQWALRV